MKNQKNYLFLLISCIFVVFLYGCQGEIITNEEVPVNSTGTMSSVYYCLGPYGGRIDCIAASNHDARFILASSSEHAFVTKDGGSQWNHIPLENSRIASVSFTHRLIRHVTFWTKMLSICLQILGKPGKFKPYPI
ncbi:MAG: hypothetical protein PHI40_03215 [Caldisericia bacterium]|nr:hypothetical protein [Caldisericia bacterium]